MDENQLVFCSGSLLHIFDMASNTITTRTCEGGHCLGFVTKNPVESHVTVGAKGRSPAITIYNWPSFEVVNILKNGTTRGYTFLTYSPDGKTLCAQGDYPDFTMTLWDWRTGNIIARARSHGMLRVQFSSYTPQHFVSCGEEGVSFWQLKNTFTGSKLIQEKGHFNVLDDCEVLSVFVMPDDQVVSGCAWGNILLWSETRVVAEACQRDNKPCHDGPIVNFIYNQQIDELCTFGKDGWIKMWHFGRMKRGPVEDSLTVVIKPVFEIQIADDRGPCSMSYVLKGSLSLCDDPIWFAQDSNGSLWKVDVRVSAALEPPNRLYTAHAGAIRAVTTSPTHLRFASIAANGGLHVYDIVTGHLIGFKQFQIGGTTLLWFFKSGQTEEDILIAGFQDGTLRMLTLFIENSSIKIREESKPHTEAVSAISLNKGNNMLVSGSENGSIFVYNLLDTGHLKPIGFLELTVPVRCFTWSPAQDNIVIVCCDTSLNKAVLPGEICSGTSYKLSCEVKTIKLEEKGIEHLLHADFYENGVLYLADKKGIYEFDLETQCVLQHTPIDEEVVSVYIRKESCTWFVGLKSGILRTLIKQGSEWSVQSDMSFHDIEYGAISDICMSYDQQYLIDCGLDGNLFVYSFDKEMSPATEIVPITPSFSETVSSLEEVLIAEPSVSLEEAKKDAVLREKLAVSMMKKARVQKQLASLRLKYCRILKLNNQLPESQRMPHSEFYLDKRLQAYLQMMIDEEMITVKQKLNFKIEKSQLRLHKLKSNFIDCLASFYIEISAIRGKNTVATFVHTKLTHEFDEGDTLIKNLINKTEEKVNNVYPELSQKPVQAVSPTLAIEVDTEEPALRSVQDIYHKLSIKTKRSLKKHKLMKKRKEERKKEWQVFMATKPNQEKNLFADVSAIEHAARTIGDYKLKSADDFKLPDQSKNTSLYKLGQLIAAKHEIYNLKEEFNKKIYCLREEKVELVKKMHHLENNLLELHKELPTHNRIQPPPMPKLNVTKAFPERQFQIYPGKEPGVASPEPQEFDEEYLILYGRHDTLLSHSVDPDEDQEDTEWESQIRALRTTRQLFKQDQILQEMQNTITNFDQKLDDLSKERLQLSIDIKYLESFVCLLHQELHILLSYDDSEAAVLERVNNSLAEKHTKYLKINILQHKIDAKVADLTILETKLAALEKCFTELIAGNRFSKHLTKIYRKKYRPQVLRSSEGGSEGESSSDDSSDDEDSVANLGKTSPRIDDKCPAGCDKHIHAETLELRAKRHTIETKITSEKQCIDQMTREKDRTFKYVKMIEPVLRINQDQLEKIQKEKQAKLNETEVLVVLNCSQICGQNLLIPRHDLDKLRSRVSELQQQTDVQLDKLKKIQRYQQRLSEECSQMEMRINQLKKDIDNAMICKFGQKVDVEALEEKILEQMIHNTRASLREDELHKKYNALIRNLNEELLEKLEDLADVMRQNTYKLQMLSSLEEEKQKLLSLASRIKKASVESNDLDTEYTVDIRKLKKILQNLVLQKETIIHEIKVLSLKGRPLPPIAPIIEISTKSTTAHSKDSDDIATNECQTNRDEASSSERKAEFSLHFADEETQHPQAVQDETEAVEVDNGSKQPSDHSESNQESVEE